jgi:hypothetical protein
MGSRLPAIAPEGDGADDDMLRFAGIDRKKLRELGDAFYS